MMLYPSRAKKEDQFHTVFTHAQPIDDLLTRDEEKVLLKRIHEDQDNGALLELYRRRNAHGHLQFLHCGYNGQHGFHSILEPLSGPQSARLIPAATQLVLEAPDRRIIDAVYLLRQLCESAPCCDVPLILSDNIAEIAARLRRLSMIDYLAKSWNGVTHYYAQATGIAEPHELTVTDRSWKSHWDIEFSPVPGGEASCPISRPSVELHVSNWMRDLDLEFKSSAVIDGYRLWSWLATGQYYTDREAHTVIAEESPSGDHLLWQATHHSPDLTDPYSLFKFSYRSLTSVPYDGMRHPRHIDGDVSGEER